jgi:hypothetical protein
MFYSRALPVHEFLRHLNFFELALKMDTDTFSEKSATKVKSLHACATLLIIGT